MVQFYSCSFLKWSFMHVGDDPNKKFPAFWTIQGHKRIIRSQMLALQQTDLFSCQVSQPGETKFSPACSYKTAICTGKGDGTGQVLRTTELFSISKILEQNTKKPAININTLKNLSWARCELYVYTYMQILSLPPSWKIQLSLQFILFT